MLRLLLPCFIVFFIGEAFGQVDSSRLKLSVDWKNGERRQYLQEFVKKKGSNDSLTTYLHRKTWVSFEVLDSTVNGYLIAYKIDSTLLNKVPRERTVSAYIQSILDKMVYQFRTNEHGEFLDVENWQALQQQFLSAIEQKLAAEGEVLGTERMQMRDLLYNLLANKEQLETLLFRQALGLFSSYGYEYSEGERYKYRENLPNPFDGAEFIAYGQWRLLRDSLGRLRYEDERMTAEVDGQEFLIDVLNHMYNQMEIPYFERYQQQEELAADIHNLIFNIADDDYLTFQKDSGWVEEGAFKRVLTMIYRDNKFVQEEHRRFQLLKLQ